MSELNDYFLPVSIDNTKYVLKPRPGLICNDIFIHTPDTPIKDISKFTHAIVGIEESRGSRSNSTEGSANLIRHHLYNLASFSGNIQLADLGNLIPANELRDTYYGLRDVILILFDNGVIPIFIGSSHDVSVSVSLAYDKLSKGFTLTTVDLKTDLNFSNVKLSEEEEFLNKCFAIANKIPWFQYYNIANQSCFNTKETVDFLYSRSIDTYRLGIIRNQIADIEPILRETTFLSIDLCSLKHSDCPGQTFPSPNGLSADEFCQLARYAGFSDQLKILGIFGYNPAGDPFEVTAALIAQFIWYYLEGYQSNNHELVSSQNENFKKYIVTNNNFDSGLVFYYSNESNRWWCEVSSNILNDIYLLPCTEKDYLDALNNEIPNRWFNSYKRLNKI